LRPKKAKLGLEDWDRFLREHEWYFGATIESVKNLVGSEVFSAICWKYPDSLKAYAGHAKILSKVRLRGEPESLKKHRASAKKFFEESAVVLDIEVRVKEGIVEICYWRDGKPETWKKQDTPDSMPFLRGLAEYANGRWLVGHNILGWDLPKLREKMGDGFLAECPVWDTLVMQSLLEPWLVSQALTESHEEDQNGAAVKSSVGNAHEAEADVKVTRDLFHRQVEALQLLLDYNELSEDAPDSEAFVKHACEKLKADKNESRKCPTSPSFLHNVPQGKETVLLPGIMLPLAHWLPHISFDKLIRENQLTKNGQDESIQKIRPYQISNTIAEAVAKNLASYASATGVDLLNEMLPPWTRQAAQSLAADPVDNATNQPHTVWPHLTICSYEALNGPYDWSSAYEPFIHLRQTCLLRRVADIIEPAFIQKANIERFMGCQIAKVPEKQRGKVAPTLASDELEGARLWVDYHPARRFMASKGPWRVWNSSLSANATPTVPARNHSVKHGKLRFPQISTGDEALSILSPETSKRFEYWNCVVSMVQGILIRSRKENEDIVHVILLNQYAELDVAEEIFAQLDWAPGYGRSDFQLLNSLKRQTGGKSLVGRLEDAVKWRQFGERCAIKVEFIIPEIPMNEWAMAISKKCEDEDQEQNEKSGHSEAFDEPADDESDEPGDEKNTTAPVATDENSEPEKPDSLPESPIKRLGSQDFQEALVQFLDPWVEMLFPGNRPWILDPRVPVGGPVGLTFIEEIEIERFLRGEDIVKRFRDELGAPERKGSIHTVARYESLARRSWPNWEGFRPKTQAPAIQTIIESSEDVFVGIPTGEGKSVLFQIPALEEGMGSGKLTIVISPLRALMKDQVVSLHKKGYVFSADYLSSDLDRWGLAEAHQRIIDGTTTLLYVAPERFRNARFLDAIRRRYDFDEGFGYIVLDEAHCFWLWGNEFRPDYFNAVGYLRKEFRDQGAAFRFLLFSATVTESVLAHVRTKLGHGLDGLGLEVSPKDRLHPVRDFLSLVPKPFPGASGGNYRDRLEARVGKMAKLIEDEKINPKNSLVLVFVPMKRQAEECAEILGTKLVSRKNFICRLENF
jgi:hypothetical protein